MQTARRVYVDNDVTASAPAGDGGVPVRYEAWVRVTDRRAPGVVMLFRNGTAECGPVNSVYLDAFSSDEEPDIV